MRALFFVTLVACGSQQTPAQTQTETPAPSQTTATTQTVAPTASASTAPIETCKTNDDCAMSTAHACCQPCALPPFADLKSDVESLKMKCSLVECAMRVPQECKPTESIDAYHAECHDAACVAVRNPPPPPLPIAPAGLESAASCATDAECMVTNQPSCCERCQADAYATNQREMDAQRRRCAIVDCSMDRSQPCAPIVSASLYRAVCRAHKCAGVKR